MTENTDLQGNNPDLRWDIFLAHASRDNEQALMLAHALTPHCRVYMDRLRLQPGDNWSEEIQEAQRASRMTVALIAKATVADAYYLQEEINVAITLCRQGNHRL